MASKTTEYIGNGTMGYCGHACRQFIKSLPLNESTEWTMMNIRGFTKTNSSIYLQDVRGPRVTPSHVMMINTRLLPKWKLDNEQQFCHVITKFKVYDPLYDMEFENMLYYCCFLYTKLDFTDINIGDTVDFEMQQQHDYSHTFWHSVGPGRAHWPTGCLGFKPSDAKQLTGIDVVQNAKEAMETFNKEKMKRVN